MRFIRYLLLFYLSIHCNLGNAQVDFSTNYKPLTSNNTEQVKMLGKVNSKYKTILDNLGGEYKTHYKDLYKQLETVKIKDIQNNTYLFHNTFKDFFANIVSEIKKSNPSLLNSDIEFLVSKEYSPNAYMSIDGSLTFNLSLLANCENESQVAFIICHELAHYQLKHAQKAVAKNFDLLYSRQGQQQLKNIGKLKYDSYEKAEAYLKSAIFDNRKHSREYEQEADSLAIMYLRNTRFDLKQSPLCLLMLDKIDSSMFLPNFDINKIFDAPQYPFKKSWLEEEETMFSKGKRIFDGQWDEDSLKTHPACKIRATRVNKLLESINVTQGVTSSQTHNTFLQIKETAEFENLIATFDYDKIDFCIFQTLKSLQKHPDNIFLHALLGYCFNELHNARKAHTFSLKVSIPSQQHSDTYKPFLIFLNNLTSKELALINYHYLKNKNSTYLEDEFFLYSFLVAAKNVDQKEDYNTHKTLYLKRYPNGKFRDKIAKL